METIWADWAPVVALQTSQLRWQLRSDLGLMEQVCVPVAAIGLGIVTVGLLLSWIWYLRNHVRRVQAQLIQSSEDSTSLSELFGSELEKLRNQLMQSREDSDSLDEILSSILQGGLPGHLEMASMDYWCVKTMEVRYTDQNGKQQLWCQSGYHVNCFIPGGARDVEVSFSVVGGTPCMQVDRSKRGWPWAYDEQGKMTPDKFKYARCPSNIRFEIRGPSLGAFVSRVTEVHDAKSSQDAASPTPSAEKAAIRECS